MARQLAYALITPYSLRKSRTGGIIGRIMTLSDLDWAGVRMYAPSDEFMHAYVATVQAQDSEPDVKRLLVDYVNNCLRPKNRFGIPNRTMVLFLAGDDAVRKLRRDVIGSMGSEPVGDTVRGTFGDCVSRADGTVEYFEPAVITAPDDATNRKQLALFARYADSDGGILEHVMKFPEGVEPETALVILKPENFSKRTARPGNIIDLFSKTGLYIVGAKLLRLSVAQGVEFYGPLLEVFPEKLKPVVANGLAEALKETFEFSVDAETVNRMAEHLKDFNARWEFNRIVQYMTGVNPAALRPGEENRPGTEKCLALLYQGENAVAKIRDRLGPTDPSKAPAGTVRSEVGRDLMVNAAHASDSVENAMRERRIIGMIEDKDPEIKHVIEEYLSNDQ